MATAIRNEGRALGSEPRYLFVTGSLQVKYLKPAENALPLRLEAQVQSIKLDKKYTVQCRVLSQNTLVAEGDVVALLVYRSDRPTEGNPIFVPK
jgi:acyl-CoA thioesterase FadM